MADNEVTDVTSLTVELLSVYLSNNTVPPSELAELIRTTRSALAEQEATGAAETAGETFTPAVSVRKSLASPEHILSLIDGKPYKTLKRHLATHGLTPQTYRERYNLAAGYPMVAPAFAEQRRAIAEAIGLGGRRKAAAAKAAEAKAGAPKQGAPLSDVEAKADSADAKAPGKRSNKTPKAEGKSTPAGAGVSQPAPAAIAKAPAKPKRTAKGADMQPATTSDEKATTAPRGNRGKLKLNLTGEPKKVSEVPAAATETAAAGKADAKAKPARRMARSKASPSGAAQADTKAG